MQTRPDRTTIEVVGAGFRAVVVCRTDGGPIRRILPGHRTIPVGIVTSRKAGRPLAYESRTELAVMKICEIDLAVRGYLTQPHLLRIETEAGLFDYYPDVELVNADGSIGVVEAKGDRDRRTSQPRYVEKMELATRVYRDLGYRFEIVHERDVRSSATLRAAGTAWPNRFVAISAEMRFAAVELASTGTATVGVLMSHLGGGALGEARLDALAISRLVAWNGYPHRRTDALCRLVDDREKPLAWGR